MSLHKRLKERSPSASELEAQKRRMGNVPTIEELEARLQETEQAFRDASHFQGYEPEEVPVDDGAPPSPPDEVIVSPWFHQLDVSWADPLSQDFVVRAFLRVTKVSTPAEQKSIETQLWGGSVADLAAEPYTVEVSFEDRWGRLSDWSEPVQATPSLTVAESIDLTEAEIAGALGWDNLEPLTDPTNLGDDVVTARAMATQNLAATRLWAEVGAFESAMIGSLAVDKLIAGTFTAGDITLAGAGALKAGQLKFDSSGLAMPRVTGFQSPATLKEYKISSTDNLSALAFYKQGTTSMGANLRADGDGTTPGRIVLQSTIDGTLSAATSGILEIRSGPDGGILYFTGRLQSAKGVEPAYQSPIRTLPMPATTTFQHNLGYVPTFKQIVIHDWTQFEKNCYVEMINSTSVRIRCDFSLQGGTADVSIALL